MHGKGLAGSLPLGSESIKWCEGGMVCGQAIVTTTSLGNRVWYGKVQARLTPTSDVQERSRGGPALARARLSSHPYKRCITCRNLSMLGVVSTPP